VRICVVGAGAIGGMLAARLALSGNDVSLLARGAHLQAIRDNGLLLIGEDGAQQVARPVCATDVLAQAGPQDLVILALKAHQLADVAAQLDLLLDAGTRIVTMQNGIPWWYFHGLDGPWSGTTLHSLDPDGTLARHIPVARVIGSVVYPACEVVRPGVVQVIEGNRFSLGEPDGSDSESLRAVSAAFKNAGLRAPVTTDIRSEIWLKVWGNLSFNPISALTHATLEDICLHAPTRALAATMMTEAQAIGERLGVRFKVSLDKRIAGAQAVGAHKTSMLQDVEQGRPLELQALVGSVAELGRITQIPTPAIDTVLALASLLARTLQQHRGRLRIT
jgi:2-dehydropantoate 2-reductase